MPQASGAAATSNVVVPVLDHAAVAVLMLDPDTGQVTYASPPALALTGADAPLPCPVGRWSRAAGLQAMPGDRTFVDPLRRVADGGSVSGWRVAFPGPDGAPRAYWATGSQLVSGAGTSARAMVAFFPLDLLPHGHGTSAAPTGDDVQGTADGAAAGLMADTALTERALLASSISFTISDPLQDDNPLIWVNPAFERTTGYTIDAVVGRNCRFLQGPETDRDEIARIRQALQVGEPVSAEILNYRADGSAFWNSLAISPVLDGAGRTTHFVGVQTDVTVRVLAGVEHARLLAAERDARKAAEKARAQLALIESVGAMLSETLNSEEALQRVVAAVVPALGDFCAVDVVEPGPTPDGETVRRVAVAHRDPEKAALYWRLGELDRRDPERSYVPQMLRTGRPVLVLPMTDADYRERAGGDDESYELIRALDVHSGAVVPLRARGRVIATLSVVRSRQGGRPFGPEDLSLAESLADRAALAVDNARLFEAEAAQRRRADTLSAAGSALAASLRSADVVDVLLEQIVPVFADWAFIHLDGTGSPSLRPPGVGGSLLPVASRHADPQRESAAAELLRGWTPAPDQPGAGRAWSTATADWLADLPAALAAAGADPHLVDAVRTLCAGETISVPLTARGQTVGALTACRRGDRAFSAQDLQFLGDLARRGALALENARLYETQRVVALELQRSLLPDRLPTLADLDVAGRYLAGAAGTQVGGDWYDVVQLPDGGVAVAVGDVMGRGVRAAAVMGQMRSALRSYAVEGLSPAQVLARMAAFTQVLEGDHLVTCLAGRFDPATGRIQVASAGHPAPLLVRAGGGAALVDVEPGLPLGVDPPGGGDAGEGAYPETVLDLPPGSGLLLFTDGLVEDRVVPVGEGLARLEAGMATVDARSADDLCDLALRLMGRLDSHDDDTAVLAVRRADGPPGTDGGARRAAARFVLSDGGPAAAARARQVLREALGDGDLDRLADTATLLVSELVTNALRHGGGPRELLVDVHAGGVHVSVSDSSPVPPLQRDQGATLDVLPETGRGLLLVEALADDWGWAQEPLGKRVWFRLRA